MGNDDSKEKKPEKKSEKGKEKVEVKVKVEEKVEEKVKKEDTEKSISAKKEEKVEEKPKPEKKTPQKITEKSKRIQQQASDYFFIWDVSAYEKSKKTDSYATKHEKITENIIRTKAKSDGKYKAIKMENFSDLTSSEKAKVKF